GPSKRAIIKTYLKNTSRKISPKTLVQRSLIDNPVDEQKSKEWEDAHEDKYFKEAAGILKNGVRYIDQEEFEDGLDETVTDLRSAIMGVKKEKPYVILKYHDEDSSDWTYELAIEKGMPPAADIIYVNKDKDIERLKKLIAKKGINNLVIMDDAGFSGLNITEEYINNKMHSIAGMAEFNLHIAIPFMTKTAENNINNGLQQIDGINLNICKHESIETIEDIVRRQRPGTDADKILATLDHMYGESYEYDSNYNSSLALTYFQHKIADGWSVHKDVFLGQVKTPSGQVSMYKPFMHEDVPAPYKSDYIEKVYGFLDKERASPEKKIWITASDILLITGLASLLVVLIIAFTTPLLPAVPAMIITGFKTYHGVLTSNPLITKIITTTLITFFGDVMAQKIEQIIVPPEERKFDFKRMIETTVKFTLIIGIGMHYWHKLMDFIYSGKGVINIIDKVKWTLLLTCPLVHYINFAVPVMMSKRSWSERFSARTFREIGDRFDKKFPKVVKKDLIVWHLFVFPILFALPEKYAEYRVLIQNIVAIPWMVYLSLAAYDELEPVEYTEEERGELKVEPGQQVVISDKRIDGINTIPLPVDKKVAVLELAPGDSANYAGKFINKLKEDNTIESFSDSVKIKDLEFYAPSIILVPLGDPDMEKLVRDYAKSSKESVLLVFYESPRIEEELNVVYPFDEQKAKLKKEAIQKHRSQVDRIALDEVAIDFSRALACKEGVPGGYLEGFNITEIANGEEKEIDQKEKHILGDTLKFDNKQPAIFVSPHPDDMEFAASAMVSYLVESGIKTYNWVFSPGLGARMKGFDNLDISKDSDKVKQKMEIREKETNEGRKLLGIDGVKMMNLPSVSFPVLAEDKARVIEKDINRVVGEIEELLASGEYDIKEGKFKVVIPDKNDAHPRHNISTHIMLEALKRVSREKDIVIQLLYYQAPWSGGANTYFYSENPSGEFTRDKEKANAVIGTEICSSAGMGANLKDPEELGGKYAERFRIERILPEVEEIVLLSEPEEKIEGELSDIKLADDYGSADFWCGYKYKKSAIIAALLDGEKGLKRLAELLLKDDELAAAEVALKYSKKLKLIKKTGLDKIFIEIKDSLREPKVWELLGYDSFIKDAKDLVAKLHMFNTSVNFSDKNNLAGSIYNQAEEFLAKLGLEIYNVDKYEAGHIVTGKYKITNILEKGGMAIIYKAVHVENENIEVVIKTPILREHRYIYSLTREAKILELISESSDPAKTLFPEFHASGYDETTNMPYIVMEYIPGRTLEDFGPINDKRQLIKMLKMMLHVAYGLQFFNKLGIVWNDLRPLNIMERSLRDDTKLLDFGISSPAEEEGRYIEQPFGRLKYMSPEMEKNRLPGPSGDIYSFGVFIEKLLGVESLDRIKEKPILRSKIEKLSDTFSDMMAENPEERPDASEVISRIKQFAEENSFNLGADLEELAAPEVPEEPAKGVLFVNDERFTDGREKADAIVAIGKHSVKAKKPHPVLVERTIAAVDLYKKGVAPVIIFTGGKRRGPKSEAEMMKEIALARGVPEKAIILEEESLSTVDNAKNIAGIMKDIKLNKIVFITSDSHIERATRTFRKYIKDRTILPVTYLSNQLSEKVEFYKPTILDIIDFLLSELRFVFRYTWRMLFRRKMRIREVTAGKPIKRRKFIEILAKSITAILVLPRIIEGATVLLGKTTVKLEAVRTDRNTGMKLLAVPGKPELGYYSSVNENTDIFFTPIGLKYTHSKTTLSEMQLISDLDNADTIDFAIYGLDRKSVLDALVRAIKRGVNVRMVCDEMTSKEWVRYGPIIAGINNVLRSKNLPKVTMINKSGLMHNKFFIINKNTLWTGTQNMTDTGFTKNANAFFRIESSELAGIYQKEFDQMHRGLSRAKKSDVTPSRGINVNGMNVKVVMSPYDSPMSVLEKAVRGAKRFIHFGIFAFSSDEVGKAIYDAADPTDQIAVSVKGAMDALFANRDWSEKKTLDVKKIKGEPVDIRLAVERWSGKLHLKMMVIDENTTVIGSTNWSVNADKNNDENMLIIKDRNFTAACDLYFKEIYKDITGQEAFLNKQFFDGALVLDDFGASAGMDAAGVVVPSMNTDDIMSVMLSGNNRMEIVQNGIKEKVVALHAGDITDMVSMLVGALPFTEVLPALTKLGVKKIRKKDLPQLPGLLGKVSIYEVFTALKRIYFEKKELKPVDMALPVLIIRDEIEEEFKSAGAGNVKVKVYEDIKLVEGPDKFMLSPFVVTPAGKTEFHVNRLLLMALRKEADRERLIHALVERELTLLELISKLQKAKLYLKPEDLFEKVHQIFEDNFNGKKIDKQYAEILKQINKRDQKELYELAQKAAGNIVLLKEEAIKELDIESLPKDLRKHAQNIYESLVMSGAVNQYNVKDVKKLFTVIANKKKTLALHTFSSLRILAEKAEGIKVLDINFLIAIAENTEDNTNGAYEALLNLAQTKEMEKLLDIELLTIIAKNAGVRTASAYRALIYLSKNKKAKKILNKKFIINIARKSGNQVHKAYENLNELVEKPGLFSKLMKEEDHIMISIVSYFNNISDINYKELIKIVRNTSEKELAEWKKQKITGAKIAGKFKIKANIVSKLFYFTNNWKKQLFPGGEVESNFDTATKFLLRSITKTISFLKPLKQPPKKVKAVKKDTQELNSIEEMLKKFGKLERIPDLNRTIRYKLEDGRILAIKYDVFDAEQRDPGKLLKEAKWMGYLNQNKDGFNLESEIPVSQDVNGNYLFKLKSAPKGFADHCIIYTASEDYFKYIDDTEQNVDEFSEAMSKNARDLARLAKHGIFHTNIIPLYYDTKRVYRWNEQYRGAGRINSWLKSTKYSNLRVSGLADFEHMIHYNTLEADIGIPQDLVGEPEGLKYNIGKTLLSLFLVSGRYFRYKGLLADSNKKNIEKVLKKDIFNSFYRVFAGTDINMDYDFESIASEMIAYMGKDKWVFNSEDEDSAKENRKPDNYSGMTTEQKEEYIHLGPFSGPLPIQSVIKALHVYSSLATLEAGTSARSSEIEKTKQSIVAYLEDHQGRVDQIEFTKWLKEKGFISKEFGAPLRSFDIAMEELVVDEIISDEHAALFLVSTAVALHAGTVVDMVNLLVGALLFTEVLTALKRLGVNIKRKADLPKLPGLLGKVSIYEVFTTLQNIYLAKKEVKQIDLIKEQRIIRDAIVQELENAGAGDVEVKIYEGTELIHGPDKYMLSPFIVRPGGTREFHVNRLLLAALYRKDGKKRAEFIKALVERELTLQKLMEQIKKTEIGLSPEAIFEKANQIFEDNFNNKKVDTKYKSVLEQVKREIQKELYEFAQATVKDILLLKEESKAPAIALVTLRKDIVEEDRVPEKVSLPDKGMLALPIGEENGFSSLFIAARDDDGKLVKIVIDPVSDLNERLQQKGLSTDIDFVILTRHDKNTLNNAVNMALRGSLLIAEQGLKSSLESGIKSLNIDKTTDIRNFVFFVDDFRDRYFDTDGQSFYLPGGVSIEFFRPGQRKQYVVKVTNTAGDVSNRLVFAPVTEKAISSNYSSVEFMLGETAEDLPNTVFMGRTTLSDRAVSKTAESLGIGKEEIKDIPEDGVLEVGRTEIDGHMSVRSILFDYMLNSGELSGQAEGVVKNLLVGLNEKGKENIKNLDAGQQIIEQGKRIKHAYFIRKGSVRIIDKATGATLAVRGPGEIIGESIFFDKSVKANANVVTITDVEFSPIYEKAVPGKVKELFKRAWQHTGDIYRNNLFTGLPRRVQKLIASLVEEKVIEAGNEPVDFIADGELGNEMYIIAEGSVDVVKGKEEKHLETRTVGQFVGEMALFEKDYKRNATCRVPAGQKTRLLTIKRKDFERIAKDYPLVKFIIEQTMKDRIDSTLRKEATLGDLKYIFAELNGLKVLTPGELTVNEEYLAFVPGIDADSVWFHYDKVNLSKTPQITSPDDAIEELISSKRKKGAEQKDIDEINRRLSKLKNLSERIQSQLKGSKVLTVCLYGSILDAKKDPNDIDVIVITDDANIKEARMQPPVKLDIPGLPRKIDCITVSRDYLTGHQERVHSVQFAWYLGGIVWGEDVFKGMAKPSAENALMWSKIFLDKSFLSYMNKAEGISFKKIQKRMQKIIEVINENLQPPGYVYEEFVKESDKYVKNGDVEKYFYSAYKYIEKLHSLQHVTVALHGETVVDAIALLVKVLPFSEVSKVLNKEWGVIMEKNKLPEIPGPVGDFSIYKVFETLVNIYFQKKKPIKKLPPDLEKVKSKIIKGFAKLHEEDVKVIIYEGTELIEGPDKFILSPFIVKPDGTREFHINRLLLEALHKENGKKRELLIIKLIQRELTLQIHMKSMSFEKAHNEILKDYYQNELYEWSRTVYVKDIKSVSYQQYEKSYEIPVDLAVREAIKEVNSALNVEKQDLVISPAQVHVVERLPRGMRQEGPVTWTGSGHIFIQESLIRQIAETFIDKNNNQTEAEDAVINLLKSVIAGCYYIEYRAFIDWKWTMRKEGLEDYEIREKVEKLYETSKTYNFTINESHISEVDYNLIFCAENSVSYTGQQLIKKYGMNFTRQLLKLVPGLAIISVPYELPSKEVLISFMKNRNFLHLAKTASSMQKLMAVLDMGIFPDVPRSYAVYNDFKSLNNYRFIYKPEDIDPKDITYKPLPKPVVSKAELRHHPALKEDNKIVELREKIGSFDRLINANFAALELMFEHSEDMTRRHAEIILEYLNTMAEEYSNLAGYIASVKIREEAQEVAEKVKSMTEKINTQMSSVGQKEKLSSGTINLIKNFGITPSVLTQAKTINEMINFIHTKSFHRLEEITKNYGEEYFYTYAQNRKIYDVSKKPWFDADGTVTNPLMRSVMQWLGYGSVKILLMDDSMQAHMKMGDHSAGVYINPLPPDEGGSLRISYAEGGANVLKNMRGIRVAFVEQLFKNLGMKTEVLGENEFVNAVIDKDSGLKTAEELIAVFNTAMSALNTTYDLDNAINNRVQYTRRNAREVAREWADIFVAEDKMPFYDGRKPSAMMEANYAETCRHTWPFLQKNVNKELERLGLPLIPDDMPPGQKVIDDYFNNPVQIGLERGEFIMGLNYPTRNPDYYKDKYTEILENINKDERTSIETGSVVRQLDGYIGFETMGGIGRYLVQRANVRVAHDSLDIYALRDIDTNTIRYATVTNITDQAGQYVRKQIDIDSFRHLLDLTLYQTGPPQEITKAEYELAKQKLHAQPYAEVLGDTVRGIASSPGTGLPVTGIATYLKNHKKKQDKVLIAPYTEPDDVSAIKESKAVITTGGGTLAHAGITTREFGIPSAIISSARWEGEGADRHIVISHVIPKDYRKTTAGMWVSNESETKEIHIKEGDIITVDGLTGAVMPVSSEYQDEIRQAYVLMEGIKDGLPKKGIKKLLMGRAYPTKLVNKFEKLGRILKKTENFELIRFVAEQVFISEMDV
ncbi:phospholipase D-like domain-containing protein, partial [Elusimicrobiota bacterium]